MIDRRAAVGLVVATTLALVGPVALARSASPFRWAAAQGEIGIWFGLFLPVAIVVVAVVGALSANAVNGTGGRAIGLVAGTVVAVAFFGGWTAPGKSVVVGALGLAVKVAIADLVVARIRRAVAGRNAVATILRRLVPAAVVQAAGVSASIPLALSIRTPMGQGLLMQSAGGGLWVGPLGIAVLTLVGVGVAVLAWAAQRRGAGTDDASAESGAPNGWIAAGSAAVAMTVAAISGKGQLERAVLASADVAPTVACVAALLLFVAVVVSAAPADEELDER